ncbi:MAG: histidine phosphatase family protein [Pseudomonadota bacterium]
MTRFHWVRHGPTHAKTFVGWRDVPADLSDTAQIARLNALLPLNAVVVSSDLSRAVATADTLGRTRLPNDAGLREFNFGDWDGLPFDQVAASAPDLSRAYWETPGDVTPPNGESWNRAAARITPCVARLGADHPGADIIIVAHYGVILTQIQAALGITAAQALKFKIDNLSITTIIDHGAGHSIARINHIP